MHRTCGTLVILGWITLFGCAGPTRPAAPATTQSARVIGAVYGKSITAADVELTSPIDATVKFGSQDDERWELMGRIGSEFGTPILERFVKERRIAATKEEIAKFNRILKKRQREDGREREDRLEEIKGELAATTLPADRRSKLLEEQKSLEKVQNAFRDIEDDEPSEDEEIAKAFILAWKVERELHRTYGGRIIFQQFGPEALDGRRLLFEEAEKRGDLKFFDPGVRHLFYYYANMEHAVIEDVDLEKPWFFDED